MNPAKLLTSLLLAALPALCGAQSDTTVFGLLDLTRPGLERVAGLHRAGDDTSAAEALLTYYRDRASVVCPDVDLAHITITPDQQRWADEAMQHRFFVHTGYQPSFFYGDDIDWQLWPVRDNELRWQLHRMKWWVPMGKAYRLSGDERYAAEWCAQYLDWIDKNPLTDYQNAEVRNWTDAPNVCFAWRPLEVSDRLEFQIHQLLYFLPSQHFDAPFLLRFLGNYHRHAQHITRHFSARGNHLLFEAQRLIFAGVFFPEFRDAARWRAEGVSILNREIKKQVYDDGMQFELDPHYHMESINIFFKALRMMDANGHRGEFPADYLATVERMITVQYNYTFPDYTLPMFSDAKLHDKTTTLPSYKEWTEVFPSNGMIRYMASEGREGATPDYLSRAFRTSGFYVLRNGWEPDATVMVLKGGPKGEWHCQPDNGTFELWSRGRNFFPDSGSYVYEGDKEVSALRRWFRQTQVHNTLTLGDRNLEKTDTRCRHWFADGATDIVVTENPSYEGLTHRRAVFFVDRKFFVIADEAYGPTTGVVKLHYNLLECTPAENTAACSVTTRFDDGNNITLRVFGASAMERSEGWVSRSYRVREARPAYAFTAHKSSAPARFITVIVPGEAPRRIEASYRGGFRADGATLHVKIDNKNYELKYNLN